jgi:hypothetical protein
MDSKEIEQIIKEQIEQRQKEKLLKELSQMDLIELQNEYNKIKQENTIEE